MLLAMEIATEDDNVSGNGSKRKKLSKKQRQRWSHYICALKNSLPTVYPVSVRTCDLADFGDATLVTKGRCKGFEIRISNRLSWHERVETLIHEFAHCLDWSHRHDADHAEHHDESWGVWYSKTYRSIQECTERLPAVLLE